MKDYFEYIDDYIAGSLSPELRAQFEEERKTNTSLSLAVDNYQEAKKLSEGLLEVDMMETLNKLQGEDGEDKSEKPKSNLKRNLLVLSAVLAALLLVGWWMKSNSDLESDKRQILASYIKPIDTDATKSIDTIGMNAFEKGKYFFALNRFSESEEWLKQYISKEKDKNLLSSGYYWLGSAHLEQWEVADAREAWSESREEEAKSNLSLLK